MALQDQDGMCGRGEAFADVIVINLAASGGIVRAKQSAEHFK